MAEGFMLQVKGKKSVQGLSRVDALKGFQTAVAENPSSVWNIGENGGCHQIAEFPGY